MTLPMYPQTGRAFIALLVASVAIFSLSAGPASAATSIGQISTTQPGYCKNSPYDLVPAGAAIQAYTVPTSGILTSWSTGAARTASATVTLKVLRGERVIASDGPHVLTPGAPSTFESQISVAAGDLIGMNAYSATPNGFDIKTACLFMSTPEDSVASMVETDTPIGGIVRPNHADVGFRLNLDAMILASPTIASVSPTTGSITGGETVTITGSEFARVQTVSFGTTDVPFTVDSEQSIRATVPYSPMPGSVPLSITTVAGTAMSSYGYEACIVPKLHGLKVKAARKKLRAAHCALGRVRRLKTISKHRKANHQKGRPQYVTRVATQAPAAGTVRGTGAMVHVNVRARSARH